ncbi:GlsB/YeaQ/YmgE family stress response membrane protein [Candidatus Accumulibacter meliphilus]|uniref:GlsB/YeaQ/YmgE family stress response membrane protein n=1 Tax=Candidatus Accumulibacter meliphilus TaxID=2211374 RepID=UPI003DA7BC7A
MRTRPAAESGGGWLFNTFGMAGVGGFNLYSLLVAVVGASVLLLVYHAVSRGLR